VSVPISRVEAPLPGRLFSERLSVPLSWHLYAPIFAVIFGGESLLTSHTDVALAIIVGFWVLAEFALWTLGYRRVTVIDDRFRAGNWRIPIAQIRGVAPLDAAAMRVEQHRRDTNVFRCTTPWIRGGVLLDVDDPDDQPFWLVSTRDPAGLIRALADSSVSTAL
jgi:hypothetical protein